MTVSMDAEKAFDTIQHSFMITILRKLSIEGTHLNIIKSTYNRHTASNMLNGEKLEASKPSDPSDTAA